MALEIFFFLQEKNKQDLEVSAIDIFALKGAHAQKATILHTWPHSLSFLELQKSVMVFNPRNFD